MLKEALNLSPELSNCFERGKMALHRENYDYAIELFTKSLALKADFASARYLLRKAEQRRFRKNPPSSLKTAFDKGASLLLFVKALYQERHKNFDAVNTYEECLRKDPFNIAVSNRLASLLLNKDMKDSAIKVLEAAIPYKRNNGFALRKLADLYYEKKDFRRARIFLEELIHNFPHDHEAPKKLKDLHASETISRISAQTINQ